MVHGSLELACGEDLDKSGAIARVAPEGCELHLTADWRCEMIFHLYFINKACLKFRE